MRCAVLSRQVRHCSIRCRYFHRLAGQSPAAKWPQLQIGRSAVIEIDTGCATDATLRGCPAVERIDLKTLVVGSGSSDTYGGPADAGCTSTINIIPTISPVRADTGSPIPS
jgi:hypothetical protein